MKNMNNLSEFYKKRPSIDGFLHIREINLFIPSPLMPEIDIANKVIMKPFGMQSLVSNVSSMHCKQNYFQN